MICERLLELRMQRNACGLQPAGRIVKDFSMLGRPMTGIGICNRHSRQSYTEESFIRVSASFAVPIWYSVYLVLLFNRKGITYPAELLTTWPQFVSKWISAAGTRQESLCAD